MYHFNSGVDHLVAVPNRYHFIKDIIIFSNAINNEIVKLL